MATNHHIVRTALPIYRRLSSLLAVKILHLALTAASVCLAIPATTVFANPSPSDSLRLESSRLSGPRPLMSLVQASTTPNDRAGVLPAAKAASGGAVLTPWSPPTDQGQLSDALKTWKNTMQGASPPVAGPLSAAQSQPASSQASVQGVSASEIRFGMVGPFTGAVKDSGRNLMIGVETAFQQVNDSGGIFGRRLKLVTADDGYEPARTADAMRRLYEQDKVFGYLCNFGTATAAVAAPFALERRALFFGAFTGSNVLRRDPPDRYVFNYRASYAEETAAVLRYLLNVKHLKPDQIAVFAQEDGFGDAGYDGAEKELRRLFGLRASDLLRLGYKRNTVDVSDAVAKIYARRTTLRAIIMVATYRGAAKLIERTRDLMPALIYTDVSGVGSTSFADELTLLGPKYATGVIVTQIVPSVDSYSTAILDYKAALAKHFPGEKPDYVSLEGYVSANLLIAGLKKTGSQLEGERLVDALETLHGYDMGLGTPLSFGPIEHQASHKIWGTVLDGAGHYQSLDLE